MELCKKRENSFYTFKMKTKQNHPFKIPYQGKKNRLQIAQWSSTCLKTFSETEFCAV